MKLNLSDDCKDNCRLLKVFGLIITILFIVYYVLTGVEKSDILLIVLIVIVLGAYLRWLYSLRYFDMYIIIEGKEIKSYLRNKNLCILRTDVKLYYGMFEVVAFGDTDKWGTRQYIMISNEPFEISKRDRYTKRSLIAEDVSKQIIIPYNDNTMGFLKFREGINLSKTEHS